MSPLIRVGIGHNRRLYRDRALVSTMSRADTEISQMEIYAAKTVSEANKVLVQSLAKRVDDQERSLTVLTGHGNVPGALQTMREKQAESAAAQGKRLGDLEATIKALTHELESVKSSNVDIRARIGAGVAAVTGLVGLGLAVAKLFQ